MDFEDVFLLNLKDSEEIWLEVTYSMQHHSTKSLDSEEIRNTYAKS